MKKNNNLIPIRNAPGYLKDTKTKVVINTNEADYQRILERRRHKKELETVNEEVNSLKKELNSLKEMITKAMGNK